MAKRFLSIFLGLMLILSCMPAMAYDYPDADGMYKIDLSGTAPVLKLNDVAVNGVLTERGSVSIVNDPKGSGEKVVQLDNTTRTAFDSGTGSIYGVGSALALDFGDAPLRGKVVVNFKYLDKKTTTATTNTMYLNRPLHLSDSFTKASATGEYSFLTGSYAGFVVTKYTVNGTDISDEVSPLTPSNWNDYTVLFDTDNERFKLWINGQQLKPSTASCGEWFPMEVFDISNGLKNINFAAFYRHNSSNNSYRNNDTDFFKDISFGVCEGDDTWEPVKMNIETFEGTLSDKTVNTYVNCATDFNNSTKSSDGVSLTVGSKTKVTMRNEVPSGTVNTPNTGKAFYAYHDTVNNQYWHGAYVQFARVTDTTNTASYESFTEPLAVEFDVCNITETEGLRTRPVTFEYEGTDIRDMDFVSFDKAGIYVGGTLVKSENTFNKWYNIKMIYNPNSDTCKVFIDNEECGEISLKKAALEQILLGTGKNYYDAGETDPFRPGVREVYIDNVKIYNYDNNLVVEDVAFAEADGTLSFSGKVVNKLDAVASVSAYPIIAVYNKETGALEKVTFGESKTASNNGTPAELSASISEGLPAAYTAKAFIWQGDRAKLLPFETEAYFGTFTYSK